MGLQGYRLDHKMSDSMSLSADEAGRQQAYSTKETFVGFAGFTYALFLTPLGHAIRDGFDAVLGRLTPKGMVEGSD